MFICNLYLSNYLCITFSFVFSSLHFSYGISTIHLWCIWIIDICHIPFKVELPPNSPVFFSRTYRFLFIDLLTIEKEVGQTRLSCVSWSYYLGSLFFSNNSLDFDDRKSIPCKNCKVHGNFVSWHSYLQQFWPADILNSINN